MKLYGHLRKDRFDVGMEIEIKPEFLKILTPDQYKKVAERVKRLEKILSIADTLKALSIKIK
jgi:predicted component of type VI protein secretion system